MSGLLFATSVHGGVLFERRAHDVVVVSDTLAYVCSVSHDADDLGTVSLLEIDLTTETLGLPEVLYTATAANDLGTTTDECSIALSPDQSHLVVAYPVEWFGVVYDLMPQVSVKDLGEGTWQHVLQYASDNFTPVEPPASLEIRELGGTWLLFHNFDTGTEVQPRVRRYASLTDLLDAEHTNLNLILENSVDAQHGSLAAWTDLGTGLVEFGFLLGTDGAPVGWQLGDVDATGGLVNEFENDFDMAAASVHGSRAATLFPKEYHNISTDLRYRVALAAPFIRAGYRLLMHEVGAGGSDNLYLAEPLSGPYAVGGPETEGDPSVPEIFGFPFTLDVVLSSDEQWVFASRDFDTSRLALHRIPAAFPSGTGPEQLEQGTQLPGPAFCGTPKSEPLSSSLDVFKYQNDFVQAAELPGGEEILVVYLACPGGNPDDAELVARVLPLDFPRLVDDSFTTPRGQALVVAAPGVLANDTELDAPVLGVFEGASGGTVNLDPDGAFFYTPTPSFCGEDEFTYSVTQGGETYLARVAVDVECPAAAWWTFDELVPGVRGTALAENDRAVDVGGDRRDLHVYMDGADDGPFVVGGSPLTGSPAALQLNGAESELLRFVPGYGAFNDDGPAAGPDLDFGASTSFTLEAILRTPASSTYQAIVGKVTGSGVASSWFMQVSNTGVLQGKIADDTNFTTLTGSTAFDDDEWHHVAFVRDVGADELRLYVDGVLDIALPDTTTGSLTTSSPIAVGAFGEDGNFERQLDGEVDEVRISLEALPPEEFLYSTAHYPHAEDDAGWVDSSGEPRSFLVTANDDFGLDGPGSWPIAVVETDQASATVDDAGTVDPSDDALVVDVSPGYMGPASVVYSIADANGDVAKATLSLTALEGGVFLDGFESGDTSNWSATVGGP